MYGFEVIEHSQDPAPMSDASMGFGVALGQGYIEHPDDPEFTAHVLACKAKTTADEKWRIVAPEANRGSARRASRSRRMSRS